MYAFLSSNVTFPSLLFGALGVPRFLLNDLIFPFLFVVLFFEGALINILCLYYFDRAYPSVRIFSESFTVSLSSCGGSVLKVLHDFRTHFSFIFI